MTRTGRAGRLWVGRVGGLSGYFAHPYIYVCAQCNYFDLALSVFGLFPGRLMVVNYFDLKKIRSKSILSQTFLQLYYVMTREG